jgi:exopolysaccharide biosynthesis polyprenyl glycosylphosphotransferase
VFDRHQRTVAVLFALADAVVITCAFEAAYQTRIALPLERIFFINPPGKTLLWSVALLLWLGVGFWIGIYRRLYLTNATAVFTNTLKQASLGTLGFLAVQHLIDPHLDVSRLFIALFCVFTFVLLLLYRLIFGQIRGRIRRQTGAQIHYVIVGIDDRGREFGRQLEAASRYDIRLLAFIDPSNGSLTEIRLEQSYDVHRLEALPGLIRQHVVDEIIFAVDRSMLPSLEDAFLFCEEEGVRTRIVVDIFPNIHSHMYLDRFGEIPLLTFSPVPHAEFHLFTKRAIDILVSATVLTLMTPFLLFVASLVKLTSKGSLIFGQERCGLNGRKFRCYKFRSMIHQAEDMRMELDHLNEKDGPAFKIADDPRLTRIGWYLRKFSVDELPQLWNVLCGHMSLVGPRPAVPSEIEQYEPWQRRRLRMRPGLTCLWAVRGRDKLDFKTWMKLDLEYIETWSLGLDLKILAQTIPLVLSGRDAN